jgi:glycosyltransferase involved in cell wall biosynthesis/SAM-dependent methyltransferase
MPLSSARRSEARRTIRPLQSANGGFLVENLGLYDCKLMDICTIIAKNYIGHARVLAESFYEHHPDGRMSVLVIDDFDRYIEPSDEPFDLIDIDSIGLDERDRMAASYNVTELSTAVKPWLLRRLLKRSDCQAITYLDPDIWIYDSLEEVEGLALEHGLVLNPHLTAPLPDDGLRPHDQDILVAGAYNLGFISMRAGRESDDLLDWWSKRLLRDCVMDPENGYFVDQRWIDLAAALFPDPGILRDPGYNLAYWNLPRRTLRRNGDRYAVDGRPLRFFHFSGFDPLSPRELSRHQNRIQLADSPALAELCSAYAEQVLAHGHEEARNWPYGWASLPGGVTLDQYSRKLHRAAVYESRLNGSVFRKKGAKRLVGYLNEPDELAARGSGVTRYLGEMYRTRADLQEAYPDLRGADAARFVDWVNAHADSIGIPPALRPDGRAYDRNGQPAGSGLRSGINIAGYMSSELGVGEAARQMSSALAAAGIETVELDIPVASGEMPERLGVLAPERLPFDLNLVCVNADMVPEFAMATDPRFFEGRYSVGMWFWELAEFPGTLRRSFEPLDEVWVATEHVAEGVRAHAPIPVEVVRLPVTPEPPAELSRAELGMPDGFCFLFAFDYRSVMKRKNPLGLIDVFSRTFAPESGVTLVLKAMGNHRHPEDAAMLREAASAHPHVTLVDEMVSVREKNAMIAGCDCYVSLHRSEGFGLTLAEAMYFGKPVIATGYSGNLDFMSDENSYLVGYSMTTVGPDAPPYQPEAKWAEPDLDQAARLMQHVLANREEAAAKGALAAEDVRRTHSPEAAAEIIKARLEALAEERTSETTTIVTREEMPDEAQAPAALTPAADPNTGMAQVRHLMQFDQPPTKPTAGRLRRRMKRLYMRLLRPYSAYQRRINESMAEALDDVRSEIARRYAAAEQGRDEQLAELHAALVRNELRLDGFRDDQGELAATIGATAREADERTAKLETELAAHIEATFARLEAEFARIEAEYAARLEAELAARLETGLEARLDTLTRTQDELAATLGATTGQADERASKLEETMETALGDVAARSARQEELLRDTVGEVEALAAPLVPSSQFDLDQHPALGKVMRLKNGPDDGAGGGYKAFEDVLRGSEKEIRGRHGAYLDLLKGFAPVLDLGCGRGELLDLLSEAEMECTGVDIDPGMVARCREKGHENVVEADAISFLGELDERSFGTVFNAQLIEHLSFDQLRQLLEGSLRALRPGGLLVAESVNPHSPIALRAFWLDPTHRNPLYPETILTLCHLAGYASAVAFCPRGSGDYERDRKTEGDYAVVARAPEGASRTRR